MIKKVLIILLLAVLAAVLIIFVILSMQPYMKHIENNDNFSEETNESVKSLVSKMLRVQYRWHTEAELKKLFTDEFRQEIKIEGRFFEKEWFYFIENEDYMQSLKKTGENELTVIVRMGNFSWNYYAIIKIIQNPDGTYQVSDFSIDP